MQWWGSSFPFPEENQSRCVLIFCIANVCYCLTRNAKTLEIQNYFHTSFPVCHIWDRGVPIFCPVAVFAIKAHCFSLCAQIVFNRQAKIIHSRWAEDHLCVLASLPTASHGAHLQLLPFAAPRLERKACKLDDVTNWRRKGCFCYGILIINLPHLPEAPVALCKPVLTEKQAMNLINYLQLPQVEPCRIIFSTSISVGGQGRNKQYNTESEHHNLNAQIMTFWSSEMLQLVFLLLKKWHLAPSLWAKTSVWNFFFF